MKSIPVNDLRFVDEIQCMTSMPQIADLPQTAVSGEIDRDERSIDN
jgi:hypothetical protein